MNLTDAAIIKADLLRPNFLYHGTCNDFLVPRPGGYDGLFCAAYAPTVGQNYIPEAGSLALLAINGYQMDERVRPSQPHMNPCSDIARNHLGVAMEDCTYDHMGRAISFRVVDGHPTYRDIVRFVEDELGYQSAPEFGGDKRYWLKVKSRSEKGSVFAAADWKTPGWLLIIDGWKKMKIYDLAGDRDSDLLDLDYKKVGLFRRLEEEGYDGVKFCDFAQSRTWGNVGHRTIGFFAGSIPRLQISRTPATNFDWGPAVGDLSQQLTPEFIAWAANQ